MKFLISSEYYADFELIECKSKQQAIDYITSQGEKNKGIKVIATSENNMAYLDAFAKSSEVLWVSDYLESEE